MRRRTWLRPSLSEKAAIVRIRFPNLTSVMDNSCGVADILDRRATPYVRGAGGPTSATGRDTLRKFLVTYHGSAPPSDPAQMERIRAAFGEWVAQGRQARLEPGPPLPPGRQGDS